MRKTNFTWKNHQKIPLIIVVLAISLIFAAGCVPRKKTILFQKKTSDTIVEVKLPPEYKVQSGDVLYINVQTIDEKATAFFTGPGNAASTHDFTSSEQYLYFTGYEIGPNGCIQLPYLDSLKVIDMTTDQIASMLTDSLSPYIKDALISVKLGSFRVSVFGEVITPGTYLFFHSRVSIFEIISLARPTEYYNATNVVVTRQGPNNSCSIVRLDLTSSKVLSSPYYYLQPNDQVYIEPLKVKKYGFNTFPYALLLSTISTIAVIYSLIKD